MKRHTLILTTLAVGFTALPVLAVTTSPAGIAVVSPDAKTEIINAVVSSIDAKRGVLSASGRTYRFDPASIAFSDERKQAAGTLDSLKPGSKVTLRSVQQNGVNRLQQIVAHD